MPWAEVVALKQQQDRELLAVIEVYDRIALNGELTDEERALAAAIRERNKRIYLGLERG